MSESCNFETNDEYKESEDDHEFLFEERFKCPNKEVKLGNITELIYFCYKKNVNILDTLEQIPYLKNMGYFWDMELTYLCLTEGSELLQIQLLILLKGNFSYFPSYIDDHNTFILDLIHFLLDYKNNYVDTDENLIWNKKIESNWKDLIACLIIDNPFVLTSEIAFHLYSLYFVDFIMDYPDMHIVSSCCDNVNQINLHTIDILLSYTLPSSNAMSLFHSSVLPCGLFASKNYIDKFGFPNTFRELVNEHHFCENPNYIRQIQGWKEFRKLIRHISYSANSVYMVNNMVSAGGGIGLLPLHHKHENLLNVGQCLAETGIEFSYNIHLLAHSKTKNYPKISAVLNLLKQVMSEP